MLPASRARTNTTPAMPASTLTWSRISSFSAIASATWARNKRRNDARVRPNCPRRLDSGSSSVGMAPGPLKSDRGWSGSSAAFGAGFSASDDRCHLADSWTWPRLVWAPAACSPAVGEAIAYPAAQHTVRISGEQGAASCDPCRGVEEAVCPPVLTVGQARLFAGRDAPQAALELL